MTQRARLKTWNNSQASQRKQKREITKFYVLLARKPRQQFIQLQHKLQAQMHTVHSFFKLELSMLHLFFALPFPISVSCDVHFLSSSLSQALWRILQDKTWDFSGLKFILARSHAGVIVRAVSLSFFFQFLLSQCPSNAFHIYNSITIRINISLEKVL